MKETVDIAIDYAMRFIGTPYIWGGNNPLEGFDCSGFIQEVLKVHGVDPKGDQTSQGLYNHFNSNGLSAQIPFKGCLLFFGNSEYRITHIAMAINKTLMIEAGGGGSKIHTPSEAAEAGAYVRIRPISNRSDLVKAVYPYCELSYKG